MMVFKISEKNNLDKHSVELHVHIWKDGEIWYQKPLIILFAC